MSSGPEATSFVTAPIDLGEQRLLRVRFDADGPVRARFSSSDDRQTWIQVHELVVTGRHGAPEPIRALGRYARFEFEPPVGRTVHVSVALDPCPADEPEPEGSTEEETA